MDKPPEVPIEREAQEIEYKDDGNKWGKEKERKKKKEWQRTVMV